MLVCLLTLTITFFLLTLYSVVQTNLDWFRLEPSRLWSLKILDTGAAATLFVTLFGALLVRRQFAQSILPRINYISEISTKQDARNPNISFETWRVEIRNTGLGSAIINDTDYQLQLAGAKDNTASTKAFNEVIHELAEAGLTRGSDYWMNNMSSGFSMSQKDTFLVFEIKTEYREKISRFAMTLYFQGQLGDKYCREIFLIPRS